MTIDDPSLPGWIGRFHQHVPHVRATGIRIAGVGPDSATLVLPPNDAWRVDTARELLHPGVLTVLADSACGVAVGIATEARAPYATLDLRIDYLRAPRAGHAVSCSAHCYRVARNVAFTRAELWQDDATDQPVAAVQAAFMLSTAARRREAGGRAGAAVNGAPAARAGAADAPSEAWPARAESTAPVAASPAPADAWVPPSGRSPIPLDREVPYARFLGVQIADEASGTIYRLPADPKLVGNPSLPALHGGVTAAFAETAALLELVLHLDGGRYPKGIDFSIDYLRSARLAESFARCEILRIGSRVALVQVRCWQADPAAPIAVARGHYLLADPGSPANVPAR